MTRRGARLLNCEVEQTTGRRVCVGGGRLAACLALERRSFPILLHALPLLRGRWGSRVGVAVHSATPSLTHRFLTRHGVPGYEVAGFAVDVAAARCVVDSRTRR